MTSGEALIFPIGRKKGTSVVDDDDHSDEDDDIGDSDADALKLSSDDEDAPFSGARAPDEDESLPAPDGIEDSFIVDDDSDAEAIALPAEFSMDTHQDLAHHFKSTFISFEKQI